MRAIRKHLTYANVMVTVLLFIVLGGTAWALARNSVGTKQLKNGAVTKKKIAKSAQQEFTAPTPLTTTLPSGQTLRGEVSSFDVATASGEETRDSISFGFTLGSAPTPVVIAPSGSPPPQCPGSVAAPAASPGTLCIFLQTAPNASSFGEFDAETGNDNQTKPYGALVFADSAAAGGYGFRGTWAVTAP